MNDKSKNDSISETFMFENWDKLDLAHLVSRYSRRIARLEGFISGIALSHPEFEGIASKLLSEDLM